MKMIWAPPRDARAGLSAVAASQAAAAIPGAFEELIDPDTWPTRISYGLWTIDHGPKPYAEQNEK
ncbi:MAG: hypothetical protein JST19_13520 [Bacteroidetes bacterium]|nr:hypothetical protein [Bacteroidota bacterium]